MEKFEEIYKEEKLKATEELQREVLQSHISLIDLPVPITDPLPDQGPLAEVCQEAGIRTIEGILVCLGEETVKTTGEDFIPDLGRDPQVIIEIVIQILLKLCRRSLRSKKRE